jgi:hypothetical protein
MSERSIEKLVLEAERVDIPVTLWIRIGEAVGSNLVSNIEYLE